MSAEVSSTKRRYHAAAGGSVALAKRQKRSKLAQCKRHNRLAPIHLPQNLLFQAIRIGRHLTLRNLLVCRAVIAKLAHGQALLRTRTNRRSEGPACHRSPRVQIACSRLRIQCRADFIIGKLGEGRFRIGVIEQKTRGGIAGKIRRKSSHRCARALADSLGSGRITPAELLQALLQTGRVKRRDCKWPNAALRASRATRQPRTAFTRCVSQSSVHDLDQFVIVTGELRHRFTLAQARRYSKGPAAKKERDGSPASVSGSNILDALKVERFTSSLSLLPSLFPQSACPCASFSAYRP
jgi:hypothetical protein